MGKTSKFVFLLNTNLIKIEVLQIVNKAFLHNANTKDFKYIIFITVNKVNYYSISINKSYIFKNKIISL